jgi:hypothetical protein
MNEKEINVIIKRIRKSFLKEYELNPELYHEIDVNRVCKDNWQIERFLLDQQNINEDKAYESFIKALQWKKSFGVHERNDQYFPKEFYEIGEYEKCGRDRDGRIIHWECGKNVRKITYLPNLDKQFAAHIMEKMDSEGSRNGWTMITDTSGSGLANVSLEMQRFKIDLLQYYPQSMRSNIVIDLPWILNPVVKIIMSFLTPKLKDCVKFIKREQLTDFVDIDWIPVCLNGNRVKRVYPVGLIPLERSTHLGLNDKQIDKFYDSFKHIIARNN